MVRALYSSLRLNIATSCGSSFGAYLQVATTICNFEDEELVRYDGDYRYFLERNDNILEKVESRYVTGLAGIQKAKRVNLEEITRSKKSFGGKGGPSGRKDKGVKNAKRHAEKTL